MKKFAGVAGTAITLVVASTPTLQFGGSRSGRFGAGCGASTLGFIIEPRVRLEEVAAIRTSR